MTAPAPDLLADLRAALLRERDLERDLAAAGADVVRLLIRLHDAGHQWPRIAEAVARALGVRPTDLGIHRLAVRLRKRAERNGTPRPIRSCDGGITTPAEAREKEDAMGRIVKKRVEETWTEVDDDETLGDTDDADEEVEKDEREEPARDRRRR